MAEDLQSILAKSGIPQASVWLVIESLQKLTQERREQVAQAILAQESGAQHE